MAPCGGPDLHNARAMENVYAAHAAPTRRASWRGRPWPTRLFISARTAAAPVRAELTRRSSGHARPTDDFGAAGACGACAAAAAACSPHGSVWQSRAGTGLPVSATQARRAGASWNLLEAEKRKRTAGAPLRLPYKLPSSAGAGPSTCCTHRPRCARRWTRTRRGRTTRSSGNAQPSALLQ